VNVIGSRVAEVEEQAQRPPPGLARFCRSSGAVQQVTEITVGLSLPVPAAGLPVHLQGPRIARPGRFGPLPHPVRHAQAVQGGRFVLPVAEFTEGNQRLLVGAFCR